MIFKKEKKLGSNSFHTTKPLHSVPVNPDDWNNIQAAVGSLAEWQGGIWPHCILCQRWCLFSLRWGTQMTLQELHELASWHCSLLRAIPGPHCLLPRSNTGSQQAFSHWKGDMTGKDPKSDMKSVPQTNISFLEKNYLELITSWKYKINMSVRVCFCLIIHYYPMPAPLQMKRNKNIC